MFEVCHCEQPLIRCDHRGCRCTLCGKPENRAARVTSPPMTAPAPTDAAALREALARHFEPSAFQPAHYDGMRFWASYRDSAYDKADALIAGPLASLLAARATTDADLAKALDRIAGLEAGLEASEYLASRYRALWQGKPVRDLPEAEAANATARAALIHGGDRGEN